MHRRTLCSVQHRALLLHLALSWVSGAAPLVVHRAALSGEKYRSEAKKLMKGCVIETHFTTVTSRTVSKNRWHLWHSVTLMDMGSITGTCNKRSYDLKVNVLLKAILKLHF